MRIGELAALLGVSTRTVRYYHHQGVLPEPPRLANGYREYGMRDAIALARVRRLVELGLSLDEVRDVVADDRSRELPEILAEIDADLARQEREIQARRARLATMRERFQAGTLGPDDTASPDLVDFLQVVGMPASKAAAWDRDLLVLMDSMPAAHGKGRFFEMFESMAADPEATARGHDFYRRLDELAEAEPGDPRIAPLAAALAEYSMKHLPVDAAPGSPEWDPEAMEPFLEDLAPAQADVVRRTIALIAGSVPTATLPFDRPDPLRPPPAYAELRESSPVAPVRTPDGRRAWLVTSYDAVAAVLADRRFGLAPPGDETPGNDTLFQDGEAHTRLRRLVSKTFNPRGIALLGPRVEQLADELVSGLSRPADLVAGLATPLSITVIGELLGVAIEDRDRFLRLADATGGVDFTFGPAEDVAAAGRAWEELGAFAAELVTETRRRPGDDLFSGLITVRDTADGRLSDGELGAMVTTLVAAGYLSVRNAVATAALRLLAEERLAAFVPEHVDEVLRLQSGMTAEPFPRYAQADLELAGVPISAGDLVLVRLEAAHRDPAHFADPDRYDPARNSSPPLVFGHGLHYCLGAPLARMEVAAALAALARQLPGLRLGVPVADIEWTHGTTDRGPVALPVTW
ncbi:cytochrome P450 [Nonomuraea jiangxiensis]|uniref:Cytochrome P450 n=1 Tax=Nonomuraea jiangxiensis TaxID=633440 RepID=A0A1G8J8B9_9ACTN|nr:cytochrome P450 [Nonomuraea jiangxiensis]SDI27494.1 Cytochrome P450 [Nonomuraea jiangxiensis]